MRVLVQRSGKASVVVSDKIVGSIDSGLVLLVGFTEGDTKEKIEYLAKKVVNGGRLMSSSIIQYINCQLTNV